MTSRDSSDEFTAELVLHAYRSGYFPMADSRRGAIHWYSPDSRAIIPLEEFRVSRSLRQRIAKKSFEVRIDTSFEEVMRNCANRGETWISEEIIRVYVELHALGFAHSVETWFQNTLVGGLYGVAVQGAFFGESMFSTMTDASKVALAHLVGHLSERKFDLLDTQYVTDHLKQFGTIEISKLKYLDLLKKSLAIETSFV